MKNNRLTAVLSIVFFFFSFSVQAQEASVIKKAEELTEVLNKKITSSDKTLALTVDQRRSIVKIHVDRITEVRTVRKIAKTEEEKRERSEAINSKYYPEINQRILTKEQRSAKREYNRLAGE